MSDGKLTSLSMSMSCK